MTREGKKNTKCDEALTAGRMRIFPGNLRSPINKPRDILCNTILILLSIMPVGVGGEADEAGNVASE